MEETDRLFRSLMEVCEAVEGCPEAAGRARLCAGSYESARRLAALSPSGEWLGTVRRLLPYVEKAIDEQRRFIRAHREVVRVDRAKRVTSETVRHLAQHSEYITRVDRDGSVQPDRLLTVERDENYAIYENRFLYTLVTHLESFLAQQAREMKETDGTLSYTYRLAQAGREGAFQLEGRIDRLPGPGGQGAFSEVEDLRKQAARLMDSPLMRLLVGTAPVRYPVVRTNLIKKNPNFQKAMELYEFLIAHQDGLIAVSFGEAPGQAAPEAAGAMGALAALAQAGALLGSDVQRWNAARRAWQEENERRRLERLENGRRREEDIQRRIQQAREEEAALHREEIARREAELSLLRGELERARAEQEALRRQARERAALCRSSVEDLRDRLGAMLSAMENTENGEAGGSQ